jgi:hypothetical protein
MGLRSPAISRMLRAHSAHTELLSFPTDMTILRKQDKVTSGNPIQEGNVGYWRNLDKAKFVYLSGPQHVLTSPCYRIGKFDYVRALRFSRMRNTKVTVFRDLRPCSLVNKYQNFGGKCCLYLQAEEWINSQPKKTYFSHEKIRPHIIIICGYCTQRLHIWIPYTRLIYQTTWRHIF